MVADMDRTLSREEDGFVVEDEVVEAVNALASSGRHAFAVVTGRREQSATRVAPRLRPNAWVFEGGAVVLYGGRKTIAPPHWPRLREALVRRLELLGYRCSLGEVAVYIDGDPGDLGWLRSYGAHAVMNRGRAMVLPEGVDKGSGVRALVEAMGYRGMVVAVGDGENDLSMFEAADLKVAVANAVEELKGAADIVLRHDDGLGVLELLRMLDELPQLR